MGQNTEQTPVKYPKNASVLEDGPAMAMDADGIHILSPIVAQRLGDKKISPSLVTGLEECPARWAFSSFLGHELIKEEPDNAARRGNVFHWVMEKFFTLPPRERTPAAVRELCVEVFKQGKWDDLGDKPEVVQWLRDAVNGYYNMGAKPENVQIANMRRWGKTVPGLEVFVQGKIGKATRPVLGFIDRLVMDTRRADGSVFVEDWKSGAKAKVWNPKTKSNEGFAEQRQQLIYKLLLEQQKMKVSGARLIYPMAGAIVNVDTNDKKLLDKVVQSVEDADKALDVMIDNNTFEAKSSFMCHFCPLVKICPSRGYINHNSEKLSKAYRDQPERDVLSPGIEIR